MSVNFAILILTIWPVLDFVHSSVGKAKDSSCLHNERIEEMEKSIQKLQTQLEELTRNAQYRLPDFDSGWFQMKSQDNVLCYKQIFHEFNAVPSQVKVLVKVPDEDKYGDMKGMIFEGVGGQQNDDDGTKYTEHGGVLFAYDKYRIKLWAPNKNNGHANGHIIFLGDGFGPKGTSLLTDVADVKVLAWK